MAFARRMGLPINIDLCFSPPPSQPPFCSLDFFFFSDIHVRRQDALKNIPIELPIFYRITLMQGAVAGLKCVKKIFKNMPGPAHKWCGKILLNLGGTPRKGGDGGVILGCCNILSNRT